MKKFITLCLSLLFAATSFAQTEPGTFTLLPKVGLNLSNLTKSTLEMDMKAGFCGGLELNYQLNKSFSLTLGALYSQQGCKRSENDIKITANLEYLNVPVLFNFHITNGLVAKVGVQPGLLLNDKTHIEGKGVSGDINLRDHVRTAPEYKTQTCATLILPYPSVYPTSSATSCSTHATALALFHCSITGI